MNYKQLMRQRIFLGIIKRDHTVIKFKDLVDL